jgi:hypothetical protein
MTPHGRRAKGKQVPSGLFYKGTNSTHTSSALFTYSPPNVPPLATSTFRLDLNVQILEVYIWFIALELHVIFTSKIRPFLPSIPKVLILFRHPVESLKFRVSDNHHLNQIWVHLWRQTRKGKIHSYPVICYIWDILFFFKMNILIIKELHLHEFPFILSNNSSFFFLWY